jgi:hypothetical protein
MEIAKKDPIYGVMSEYDTPEAMMEAAYAARAAGYVIIDGFCPFPMEGLSEALGNPDHRVPYFTLAGALTGFATAYGLQFITGVLTYPINIAGRPLHAWPMYGPPTFEWTVLFGCLTGIVTMFILNGLPSPYHPVFNVDAFERASTDRFFLLIESRDPKFEIGEAGRFLQGTNPLAVHEVER